MPQMRAKIKIDSVERTEYADNLTMSAVYSGEKNSEDNTFSKATPSASFKMSITNPALLGKFEPGKKYYVDFTEAQ